MSEFYVYVKLKPFVKQWLVSALGNPVKFPAQSIENSTIHHFIGKQPADTPPETANSELTAICIPESASKPARTYNYLPPRGKCAVVECCEYLFRRNLWSELGEMSDLGCNTMTAIYGWCERHGVSIEYADTIRQRYYRLRDAYNKTGIDLTKKKRARASF